MSGLIAPVARLIEEFSKLPGVGRKTAQRLTYHMLRAPADEEEGVETYSKAWGRQRAILFWLGAVAVTYVVALLAARQVGGTTVVSATLGMLALCAVLVGGSLARAPLAGRGKRIEVLSGLWTIALYLSVGVMPYLLQR